MARLHKNLRQKGYGFRFAFKTTGVAKAISIRKYDSKWKKGKFGKYSKLDFDGDGKVNRYDCKPFNKNEQDMYKFDTLVTNSMREESKKKSSSELQEDILNKPSSIKAFEKKVRQGKEIPDLKNKLKEIIRRDNKKKEKDEEDVVRIINETKGKKEIALKPHKIPQTESKELGKLSIGELSSIAKRKMEWKSNTFDAYYERYKREGARKSQTNTGKLLSQKLREVGYARRMQGITAPLSEEEIKKLMKQAGKESKEFGNIEYD